LKSGVYPDPQADQGTHRFTYALLPHAGEWRAGEVVRRAAELNTPLLGVRGRGSGVRNHVLASSFVTCDANHVVVDTIKTAENGDGIVVRLYEAHNARGSVTLTFGQSVAHAERCNLLEEHAGDVAFDGNTVQFAIKPFEIVTLRVQLSTL
jgi:alpha-mannosidase